VGGEHKHTTNSIKYIDEGWGEGEGVLREEGGHRREEGYTREKERGGVHQGVKERGGVHEGEGERRRRGVGVHVS